MPTKIEWTDETWNPVTGCSPVSAGCDHCYAKRMANRLRGRYGYPQDDPFKVTLHPDRLDQPLRWQKSRMIFVCSMGDFWHPQVPLTFQCSMLDVMIKCPQHIFIILTKRYKQLASFNQVCGWSAESYPNIWLGLSVEDQPTADERIPILLQVPAAVIVVSYEPALGSLVLPPGFLERGKRSWCIAGGETGPGARPMNPEWTGAVKNQCVEAGVPFFLKSNGEWLPQDDCTDHMISKQPKREAFYPSTVREQVVRDNQIFVRVTKKRSGRLLDGRVWDQVPEIGL